MNEPRSEIRLLSKKDIREITVEKLFNITLGRSLRTQGVSETSVQFAEQKKTFFAAFQACQIVYFFLPDAWDDSDDKCCEHLERLRKEVDEFFKNEVRIFNAQPH